MKNNQNQTLIKHNHKFSEFQLKNIGHTLADKRYSTPQKITPPKIFLQTPQPLFIPLTQNYSETLSNQQLILSPKYQDRNLKKLSIFDRNFREALKENRQISSLNFQKSIELSSKVIKSKTSISFKKEKISKFFYYQNFIVCKAFRKIIVYNFISKQIFRIPISEETFIITSFPPYIFNCIVGQFLNLYTEKSIQIYADSIRREKNNDPRFKRQYQNEEQNQISILGDKSKTKKQSLNHNEIVIIKISKLQVECICRYNQVIYMGGYNRSVLPGGKKTQRREVYIMENLDPKINNKPKDVIKIQSSSFPVSFIQVQMPYLIVYCRPKFYLFGLKSLDLLLTFQKQLKSSFLLQGRYALNVINGVGISNISTIFTFDIESFPIYGVQITEHKQEASCVCLQKTGRIFGCYKNSLFEYIPSKRITRCVKVYSESEFILRIRFSPSNILLVLRQTQSLQSVIEAFSVDENSIADF